MLAPLLKYKKHLLLVGVFLSLITGVLLGSPALAANDDAPTLIMDKSSFITAKGGWVTEMLTGIGESALKEKTSDGKTNMYNTFYDWNKKEIYFRQIGNSSVYRTTLYTFLNDSADPSCLPALKVTSYTNPVAEVTGVVNDFIDWNDYAFTKPTAAQCEAKEKQFNQWNSSLAISVSNGTGVIEGDLEDGYQGVKIPICAVGDTACATSRTNAINEADGNVTCSTTSPAAIQQCNNHKAIINCLKSDVTKTVPNCKDIFDARDILKGNTNSIDGNTSDARIQEICNSLSDATEKATCIANAKDARLTQICVTNPEKEGCPAVSDSEASSCVIDGIGWIICGITSFVADVTDSLYSLIENILRVPVINTDTGNQGNGVYNAWVIMRNIANVAFVIMFLIIIFAQLTGQGVSNYGVKKSLPRLVVAAILVNVSFWVSAIAVDLSNIAGAGLYDIMRGVVNNMNVGISTNWGNIIQGLLGGAVAGAGGVVLGVAVLPVAAGAIAAAPEILMGLLFMAIPLVLGAVLAVVTVVLILIARQALVIILIIISPLAFVALLLPNTEKLFTRWRTTLMSLLLMYPIVSIIFGGAQVAGFAILSTAATTTDALSTMLAIITGQFVIVAPFFFIPLILTKFSGGGLDKMAANIQSRGQKLISGASGLARKQGSKAMGRGWEQLKYGDKRDPQFKNGKETRMSRLRRSSGLLGTAGRTFDQFEASKTMADGELEYNKQEAVRQRLGTDAAFATRAAAGSASGGRRLADRAVATAEAEALKKALEPLVRELATKPPADRDNFLHDRALSTTHSESERNAAIHQLALMGRDNVLTRLNNNTSAGSATAIDMSPGSATRTVIERQLQQAISANTGALIGKAPDLVKGENAAFENVSAAEMQSFSAATMKRYMDFMASQQTKSQAPATTPEELAAKTAAADAFTNAVNAFNASMQEIQANPQAVIKADAARAIISSLQGPAASVSTAVGTGASIFDPVTGAIIRK